MTKAQGRADSLSFNETDGILHLNVKPLFLEWKNKFLEIKLKHILIQRNKI